MVEVSTREPAAWRLTDADVSCHGIQVLQAALAYDGHCAAAEVILRHAKTELRSDSLQACRIGDTLHYTDVATRDLRMRTVRVFVLGRSESLRVPDYMKLVSFTLDKVE